MALLDELSSTTDDAFVGFNEELMKMEYAAANIFLGDSEEKADNVIESGNNLIFDVLYERLGGGWFADYDTFDQAQTERITQGSVPWGELYVPLQISGSDLKKNAGMTTRELVGQKSLKTIPERAKNALVSMLNSQIKHAKEDAKHLIAKAIYSDGSGNSGLQMNGFGNIIENDTADFAGMAYTELTAIDKVSQFNSPNYPWQPKNDNNSGTNRALDWAAIMKMHADIRTGGNAADYVFSDGQMFNAVTSIAQGENVKMRENSRMADLGFEHIQIVGGPTFVVDDYAPEYKLWWTNTRHIWAHIHATGWDFSGWKVPTDQNALIAQLMIMIQLICDDRGKQGVMEDYDPS